MSKIITITAGHSNTDPGAVAGIDTEAALVTMFRNALVHYLKQYGYTVRTDGTGTVNLPLRTAINLVPGSDLAIEIHLNAVVNPKARGVETISLPKDKALSQKISAAIAEVFETVVRGDKGWIDQSQSHRGKLGFVSAGGMIAELIFISNPTELAAFKGSYWVAARKMAEVIHEHLGG